MIDPEEKLFNNPLFKKVREDGNKYLPEIQILESDICTPDSIEFDELEYYIHNVGFWITYLSSWIEHLDVGVKLLSNFNYSKDVRRIDHLIYNIENYIIRLQSTQDRILHVVNAVFHTTIDEKKVNYGTVMTNLKICRTDIPLKYKTVNNFFKNHQSPRNEIIHRHGFLEKDLRKLEIIYHKNYDHIGIEYKKHRTQKLKEYIIEKKKLFNHQNEELFQIIDNFLICLLPHYIKQKERLLKYLNY